VTAVAPNPAEYEAARAWIALKGYLESGDSFVFEAGAGAGKTFSLLEALDYLIQRHGRRLVRSRQQIACITYTNVARDNILLRTDAHPSIFCETTHSFAWSLISSFQKQLRALLVKLPEWQELLADAPPADVTGVEYALGRRAIEEGKALLHHDDIFPLTIHLLESAKFRNLLTSRFPVILIDEYQDTHAELIAAFEKHFFEKVGAPQFGFFGDHWQKIYGDGCGAIDNPALKRIGKGANFRSAPAIVDCLNRIRPDLKQVVKDPCASGSVKIFHTNGWIGKRLTKNHWQGDLPQPEARSAFLEAKRILHDEHGWDFEDAMRTKILMLTQRAVATGQGYASLPNIFRFNDSFSQKRNEHLAFFIDHLEPAAEEFLKKRYGAMFEALDTRRPNFKSPADKSAWASSMSRLCELRASGTVGDVIAHLKKIGRPQLPSKLLQLEAALARAVEASEELDRRQSELKSLHSVRYTEVTELARFHQGHSPFETKHGVKGEQFENVLVVFGRGWNEYDFKSFLEMSSNLSMNAIDREDYERYRNLFYVVCSRPKTNLALLFTHLLSPTAMDTLAKWFAESPPGDLGPVI
jgi:DNA helicase II / ATP-dependent DNA helicase PcrA